MRVREDTVVRPDGKPGIYGLVEKGIATGVVALSADMEVYLVGQYRYTTSSYSWEIVEGGAEEGESPIEAAKRELYEEVGLRANKWSALGGCIHLTNCISSEEARIFLAQDLTQGQPHPEATEILEVRRVPLTEAYRMIDQHEITDAVSILALFFLKDRLKS